MCQKRKQISWSGRVLIASPASQWWGVSSVCVCTCSNDDQKITLRVTFSLTESVHLDLKTFLKSASLALISSFLINDAISVPLAGIDHVSSYTSHEESATSIACIHAVVSPRRNIPTYFAQHFWLSFDHFLLLRRGAFAICVAVF